jgi:mRNA-degrading endonuclease RelE of RelBE toxin-antitoxin system
MRIIGTDDFKREFKKLPADAAKLYKKQEKVFEKNWLDPRLHLKRIKEFLGVYSFRVMRRYQELLYFGKNEAIFFSVGHRKDIYKK